MYLLKPTMSCDVSFQYLGFTLQAQHSLGFRGRVCVWGGCVVTLEAFSLMSHSPIQCRLQSFLRSLMAYYFLTE